MELKSELTSHSFLLYSLPQRRLRSYDLEFKVILFFLDILVLLIMCIFLGPACRLILSRFFSNLPYYNISHHIYFIINNLWLFSPVIFCFLWHRLYSRLPLWEEMKRIWLSLLEGFILVYAFISLAKFNLFLSRLEIFFTFFLSIIFFPVYRYILKLFLFKFDRYKIKTLLCPDGSEAYCLAKILSKEKTFGYEPIGFLGENNFVLNKEFSDYKIFGSLRDIPKLARKQKVDAVFILLNGKPLPYLSDLYSYLQRNVGEIFFIPSFTSLGLFNAEILFLFSGPLSFIRVKNPLSSHLNQVLKRIFDFVVSFLLLLISLPFMLLISIAIKIDSPGPVIYKHKRVGRGGKTFFIYKFRTMYLDSDKRLSLFLSRHPQEKKKWFLYRKLDEDPRVTRLGSILRRFSLDELPQLWNILKGDMSLVGPRPVTTEEIDLYYKDVNHFYFAVRPGLTGLWQVSGRNKLSFDQRVKLDVWYVQNWSLWLDLVILLRTIPVIIKGEGL